MSLNFFKCSYSSISSSVITHVPWARGRGCACRKLSFRLCSESALYILYVATLICIDDHEKVVHLLGQFVVKGKAHYGNEICLFLCLIMVYIHELND